MEISSIRGLPELGMEDLAHHQQWQLSSFDEPGLVPLTAAFEQTLQQHPLGALNLNPKTTSMEAASLNGIVERPTKQLKTNTWNIPTNKCHQITTEPLFSSCSNLLSFVDSSLINNKGNQSYIVKPKEEAMCTKMNSTNNINIPNSDIFISQNGLLENQNYMFKGCEGAKKNHIGFGHNRHSQPQDHIIAERKRREKLSQRFIALSALVPGLKKMDKASVLGDAIKYLKQLQEKVNALEEEQAKKKSMESVVFVKKSQIFSDAHGSSSDSTGNFEEALPEIEARFCERNVLIRIHCEKRKGVVEKTMSVIEKLHLKVTNSSVMTFGSSALDITIIAQMDLEFCMTLKDLVRNLRTSFESFM